jgi:hypothetical protein
MGDPEPLREIEVAPQVSQYGKDNGDDHSLSEERGTDPRRAISQRKRKLIERVFARSVAVPPLLYPETAALPLHLPQENDPLHTAGNGT